MGKAIEKEVRHTRVDPKDLTAFLRGDEQAFARIYETLAPDSLRYAAMMTGNDTLSADAVQEAFLRIYRNREKFDETRPFEPWFYRILQNECRRALGWKKRLLPMERLPEKAANDPHKFLFESIRRLPAALREPIVLRYLLGYRDQEVAGMLNISLAAAKARVKRARAKLREELAESEGDNHGSK